MGAIRTSDSCADEALIVCRACCRPVWIADVHCARTVETNVYSWSIIGVAEVCIIRDPSVDVRVLAWSEEVVSVRTVDPHIDRREKCDSNVEGSRSSIARTICGRTSYGRSADCKHCA